MFSSAVITNLLLTKLRRLSNCLRLFSAYSQQYLLTRELIRKVVLELTFDTVLNCVKGDR